MIKQAWENFFAVQVNLSETGPFMGACFTLAGIITLCAATPYGIYMIGYQVFSFKAFMTIMFICFCVTVPGLAALIGFVVRYRKAVAVRYKNDEAPFLKDHCISVPAFRRLRL